MSYAIIAYVIVGMAVGLYCVYDNRSVHWAQLIGYFVLATVIWPISVAAGIYFDVYERINNRQLRRVLNLQIESWSTKKETLLETKLAMQKTIYELQDSIEEWEEKIEDAKQKLNNI
jgi:hypothetical protein